MSGRTASLRHDSVLDVAAQAFVGERGTGDVPTRAFQLPALIRAAAHGGREVGLDPFPRTVRDLSIKSAR